MICKITFRQEKFCLRSCLISVEITGFGQLLLVRGEMYGSKSSGDSGNNMEKGILNAEV